MLRRTKLGKIKDMVKRENIEKNIERTKKKRKNEVLCMGSGSVVQIDVD